MMIKHYDKALAIGTVLQGKSYQYQIEKVLGQGSFGITYMASVKMTGALGTIDTSVKVAIKEFFMGDINGRQGTTVTSGSKDGLFYDYKKKFIREAHNLSKLQHPNIIKVMETFEANNTTYYVMEYVDGGSLDEYIMQKHGLPVNEAVRLTCQIGKALSYMHSQKMLHLDLKPGNIMLRKTGEVVLIDFGLSKQYDENGHPESSTSVGGGTRGYAPLEQANYKDGKGFPVTMDVYALGATMLKMLTGTTPPDASEILNEGFPEEDFKTLNGASTFVACMAKAMSPLVKQRYQTIGDFTSSLNHCNLSSFANAKVSDYNEIGGDVSPKLIYHIPQDTSKIIISNFDGNTFGYGVDNTSYELEFESNKVKIRTFGSDPISGVSTSIPFNGSDFLKLLSDLQSLNFDLQSEGTKYETEITGEGWRFFITLYTQDTLYAKYWIASRGGDCGNIVGDKFDVERKVKEILPDAVSDLLFVKQSEHTHFKEDSLNESSMKNEEIESVNADFEYSEDNDCLDENEAKRVVPNEEAISVVAKLLKEGHNVVLPVKGDSMTPIICNGESIELKMYDRYNINDIVLTKVVDGFFDGKYQVGKIKRIMEEEEIFIKAKKWKKEELSRVDLIVGRVEFVHDLSGKKRNPYSVVDNINKKLRDVFSF